MPDPFMTGYGRARLLAKVDWRARRVTWSTCRYTFNGGATHSFGHSYLGPSIWRQRGLQVEVNFLQKRVTILSPTGMSGNPLRRGGLENRPITRRLKNRSDRVLVDQDPPPSRVGLGFLGEFKAVSPSALR